MTTHKLYPDHDPSDLEPYYCEHVEGMTEWDLHAKSDIAIQLAWRDKQIAALKAELKAARGPEEIWVANGLDCADCCAEMFSPPVFDGMTGVCDECGERNVVRVDEEGEPYCELVEDTDETPT